MQKLTDLLEIGEKEVVSLIGGGGKTTAMFTLAGELSQSSAVLVTTTTRIRVPEQHQLVLASTLEEALRKLPRKKGLVVLGTAAEGGKLRGIPTAWVGALKEIFPYVVIEADGAARKPLKGHAPYEPVIPPSSTLVLAISGMSVLGKPLHQNYVHRAEILSEATGYAEGAPVTSWLVARAHEVMARLIMKQAPNARRVGLLNQVEEDELNKLRSLTSYLAGSCYESVLLGSLLPRVKFEKQNMAAQSSVAGIVLAAGASSRMGEKNKLLLPWKGKSIVRHVVERTLRTMLDEVIVVLGYEQEKVREELSSLPVKFTFNEKYAEGQAGSLKRGIEAVERKYTGAMFILGDQPFVSESLLKTMLTAFRVEKPPAVYPTFDGKRGNPVIFNEKLFIRLMQIKGDKGGRSLLHEKGYIDIPARDDAVLKDIDTPEDWEQAKMRES